MTLLLPSVLLISLCLSISCSREPDAQRMIRNAGKILNRDLKFEKHPSHGFEGWYRMKLPFTRDGSAVNPIDSICFIECGSIEQAKTTFDSKSTNFARAERSDDPAPQVGDENVRVGRGFFTRIGKTVYIVTVTGHYYRKELRGKDELSPEYNALMQALFK